MNLLSRLKIRTKLASMVALSALTVCAIIALSASLSQSRMREDRIAQLRTAVDLLVGMAQSLQDEVAAGKMTLAEAQNQFRQRGHYMSFNNKQGYPVVYNMDTSLLMNGANPQLEGKITGATDSNGVVIAKAQIGAADQSAEGGIASYLYPRPGQTVPVQKLVFVRKFPPWNAVMAYGLYVDDLDADVSALLWRLGAIGAGVMVLMALLSWLNPQSPAMPLLYQLTAPFLEPLRRVLPRMGGIDLSPILLFVIVQVLLMVVTRLAVTLTMFGV